MPKQVLIDRRSFESFGRALNWREFRMISMPEFRKSFQRLGLIPPSPRVGREVGYSFAANGLEVVVCGPFLILDQ